MKTRFLLLALPLLLGLGVASVALAGDSDTPRVATAAAPRAVELPPPSVALEVVDAPQAAVVPAASETAAEPRVEQLVSTPPVSHGIAPVETPAAVPLVLRSRCEIGNSVYGDGDAWGVYGWTEQPRGTVFTFTISVDGDTRVIPLVARAGSMVFSDGSRYGTPGEYEDSGSTVFGNTSADMPSFSVPHGPVVASVMLDGAVICST